MHCGKCHDKYAFPAPHKNCNALAKQVLVQSYWHPKRRLQMRLPAPVACYRKTMRSSCSASAKIAACTSLVGYGAVWCNSCSIHMRLIVWTEPERWYSYKKIPVDLPAPTFHCGLTTYSIFVGLSCVSHVWCLLLNYATIPMLRSLQHLYKSFYSSQ